MDPTVRQARADDEAAVVAFAEQVWEDRPDTVDYIPDVFADWVDSDGPDQHTVVAEVDGAAAGLCQAVMLTDHEAWLQGMRVDPAHRGAGLGLAMVEHCFDWARDRGATVARNMVFSWNDAGLGQSVAAGFAPDTSFRFAHPEPDAAADPGGEAEPAPAVESDPAAAWSYWTASDARTHLSGLALDPERAWALSELPRERLHRLADEERVFAVKSDGTTGMACRTGERAGPDGDRLAEYAVGAWADRDAAGALFDAIRADAAELGVDGTRVLFPETPRHVAEAAAVRAELADWPDFVLAADLS
ncbi:GNAT family N-acetyltransferase [Haloarcula onubensis]|uniref:GNAT family N-acetyltransferase n=1 Tax=Haloarcula onubensis TaxID=2950539 RepID=A0ABU2FRI8_9EURY|nr:GNAT family N-acetyltransferase [Halomicroarcula sp. S3CR25-11]MDS0283375.1 GNAT family N-acetyltransferase [Halomicroarcula sp. S3CR25-11]